MQTSLPFDNTYARLPDRFFAKLDPKPVAEPKLIALNSKLAEELGLDPEALRNKVSVEAFAGNGNFGGSEPLAMAYAGLQFGGWSPQLGDGRALLLGELVDKSGKRFDVQLKGSGPTPFSRNGDGRAWLGPVLREYIVSEAMAALGVKTTRALAAVATGEDVIREQVLPGAVLTRVSRSLIRVGTFQYFAARQDEEALKLLTNYAIDRLYPEARNSENPVLSFLESVVAAQADLIAHWMSLGFIHGVMNTDNVSIAGETIDYGPCAYIDDYHPGRVFSSIDETGRYAYSNQPRIAHWNLVQFAQCLIALLDPSQKKAVELAQSAIDRFPDLYMQAWQSRMNAKLGLSDIREGDTDLINGLLKVMAEAKADFTLTFRYLATGHLDKMTAQFDDPSGIGDWIDRLVKRQDSSGQTPKQRKDLMTAASPAFIPRNHRIEQVIRSALEENYAPFHRLIKVLEDPYRDQPDAGDLMSPPQPKEVVRHTFCGT